MGERFMSERIKMLLETQANVWVVVEIPGGGLT